MKAQPKIAPFVAYSCNTSPCPNQQMRFQNAAQDTPK